jgi:hypothetical protein
MDFDLNDDLDLDEDLDLEVMIPKIKAEVGVEQHQVSVSVSTGNFIDSDSSIEEVQSEVVNDSHEINVAETNVRVDNAGALVFFHDQQLQNNPQGHGFHLPADLLQVIDQPALSSGHQPSSLNLHIGYMTQQDYRVADPVFEKFSVQMET